MLAFAYVSMLQRGCGIFVRRQKDWELPTGVPNHLFSFPEKYGTERTGIPLQFEQLKEVAELSGISTDQHEFAENDLFQMFKEYILDPEKIESKDAKIFMFYSRIH